MEEIHPDWKEFLQLLSSHKVKFVIIGGHALAFHGVPRFTGDLDCFVLTDPENATKLLQVLKDFGFGSSGVTLQDLQLSNKVFMLGTAPFRIDILNSIDGVSFAEAWENRQIGTLGGISVPFLSRELFLKNKAASGRAKDLSDIESLQG